MITFDALKKLNPTKLDLTRFELRRIEMPVELPTITAPSLDFPIDKVAGLVRDAAYVGVGAAVVAARAADDRRRELTGELTAQVRKLVDTVA